MLDVSWVVIANSHGIALWSSLVYQVVDDFPIANGYPTGLGVLTMHVPTCAILEDPKHHPQISQIVNAIPTVGVIISYKPDIPQVTFRFRVIQHF